MDIGSRIKELRLAKKIKAIELARMANISQPYLSDIENGRTKPSLDTLEAICNSLGITMSDFFADKSTSLSPDILQLLENAKKLPPAERKALNEYLKVRLASMEKKTVDLTKYSTKKNNHQSNKSCSHPSSWGIGGWRTNDGHRLL